MRNSQEVATTIKTLAKSKKITIGKMLSDCELSKNALSTMQSGGYLPRTETLAKIADYLDCSVDYLLGRVDTPNATYSITGDNNVQVNGNNGNNSPLTVNSKDYDETTKELVQLVQSLSLVKRAEAILYLNELKAKK